MSSSGVVFRKKKTSSKAFRKRKASDEEDEKTKEITEPTNELAVVQDDDEPGLQQLQETRELQRLRQRNGGLSHWALGSGKKVSKVEEMVAEDDDPFKIKTGGLLDLKKARVAKAMEEGGVTAVEREGLMETLVGTQFSKETRMRDEDEEMRKFIETEMHKRRAGENDDGKEKKEEYLAPEEKALQALPDHLRKSTFKKNEEMLSSQMLSGIPEMDLGIEEKIRNIEATEQAKRQLADQAKKKNRPSDFVPTNLAVNFKQPNRFKTEVEEQAKRIRYDVDAVSGSIKEKANAAAATTHRTVKVGDVPEETVISGGEGGKGSGNGSGNRGGPDKATDDLHLSKFKQHFHRK